METASEKSCLGLEPVEFLSSRRWSSYGNDVRIVRGKRFFSSRKTPDGGESFICFESHVVVTNDANILKENNCAAGGGTFGWQTFCCGAGSNMNTRKSIYFDYLLNLFNNLFCYIPRHARRIFSLIAFLHTQNNLASSRKPRAAFDAGLRLILSLLQSRMVNETSVCASGRIFHSRWTTSGSELCSKALIWLRASR